MPARKRSAPRNKPATSRAAAPINAKTQLANSVRYEEIARALLERFRFHFGFERVEGTQHVDSAVTDPWEIDGKAVLNGNSGFIMIECRQYPKNRLKRKDLGAIVFEIKDIGAAGGIVISPLALQRGAKKIADAHNVVPIRLNAEATLTEFVMQLKGVAFVGLADTILTRDLTPQINVTRASCGAGRHDECPGECACACHTASA